MEHPFKICPLPSFNELPEGWKTMPCPNDPHGWQTCWNGKSLFSPELVRGLVRVKPGGGKRDGTGAPNPALKAVVGDGKGMAPKRKPYHEPTEEELRTLQVLARKQMKQRLLTDLLFDAQVCALHNWDPREYPTELVDALKGYATP